jgi:hypothetical protein
MRNAAKKYVRQGQKRALLSSKLRDHAIEIADKIGQDIVSHLNPDSEIGPLLSSNDKVSFKTECNGWQESSRDAPICFSTTVEASAHINGNHEIFFPFTVDVSVKAFNFRKLKKEELEERLSHLQDKFGKKHEVNDKKRDALSAILYGLRENMIDENAFEFIEKNIISLEKAK